MCTSEPVREAGGSRNIFGLSADYLLTINARFLISYRPLRGLAAIYPADPGALAPGFMPLCRLFSQTIDGLVCHRPNYRTSLCRLSKHVR